MAKTSLDNGDMVGERYRIVGLLGKGGMSSVYAAEDVKLQGKLRAVKLLCADPPDRQALSGEAVVLMKLQHPHLPLIVDYYEAHEELPPVLITDFVEGETLQERFIRHKLELSLREILDISLQLCSALKYLHGQAPPIIHRDIKPSNVMIDRSGHVRLIDFGIARFAKNGVDTRQLGTPGFAAPEQGGENGRSDIRTDIYGLGALIYYLVSGGRHFNPEKPFCDTSSGPARIPAALQRILERMLHFRPLYRYAAVYEAQAAFADLNQRALRPEFDPAYRSGSPAKRHGSNAEHPASGSGSLSVPLSVAVASFVPGSGATFIAATLAKLLSRTGYPIAYVEHYTNEPEAYGLFNGEAVIPSSRPLAPIYTDNRYTGWRDGTCRMIVLNPHAADSSADSDKKFRLMLRALDAEIVIHDVSSGWMLPETSELLQECDICLFAADPFPSKWTMERMRCWQKLSTSRADARKTTQWIANKDIRFARRGDWLRMFPDKPAAVVPLLPAAEWMDWLWRGRWATDHPRWGAQLQRALASVLDSCLESGMKRSFRNRM
jgi:serine/threonine protein kinase